ncbi:MAG: metal-sulfur cluster assembly factor [Candidatus ainarchaeum sp.]|nr:metal-sulfur cluster assembly factor [Candidatus ainarchaeum sp.]
MVSKEEILGKLSQVMDPELGINIVDLGLVYEVGIKKKEKGRNQQAYVRMTFTTPACPMMNEMISQMKQKLDEIPGTDIEVSIVFDPPWTPERLSQKAKIKLGII